MMTARPEVCPGLANTTTTQEAVMPAKPSKDSRSFEEKFGSVFDRAASKPVPAGQKPQKPGKAARGKASKADMVPQPAPAPVVAVPTLADRIKAAHGRFLAGLRATLETAREAGDLLILAKKEAGHGNWLAWFHEAQIGFSEDTAQRYMRLAAGWAKISNTARTRYLDLADALALLTDREPNPPQTAGLEEAQPPPRKLIGPPPAQANLPRIPVEDSSDPPVVEPPPAPPAPSHEAPPAPAPSPAPPYGSGPEPPTLLCPHCGFRFSP